MTHELNEPRRGEKTEHTSDGHIEQATRKPDESWPSSDVGDGIETGNEHK